MKRKHGLTPLQRIERCRTYNGNCWEVSFSPNKQYPLIKVDGRHLSVHRVVFETLVGPIENGLYVLHRCDNPRCHNPAHLYLGTLSQNMQDMWKRGRHAVPRRRVDVAQILKLQKDETKSQKEIADETGCAQTTVSVVLRQHALARGRHTSFGKHKSWATRKQK